MRAFFSSATIFDQFHTASAAGKIDEVRRILLKKPELLNKIDSQGETALCKAVRSGKYDVISFLIENPKIKINFGNPLAIAATTKDHEACSLLLGHKDIDSNGGQPLAIAATNNDHKIITLLLENKKTDPNLGEPLAMSAKHGSFESVRLLHQRGATLRKSVSDYGIDYSKAKDLYVYLIACGLRISYEQGQVSLLEEMSKEEQGRNFLVNKFNNRCNKGQKSLAFGKKAPCRDAKDYLRDAAKNGDLKNVKNLLSANNTQLDVADNYGRTALLKAISLGYEEIALALIEAGADPNIVDDRGNLAINYAIDQSNAKLFIALLDHGAALDIGPIEHSPLSRIFKTSRFFDEKNEIQIAAIAILNRPKILRKEVSEVVANTETTAKNPPNTPNIRVEEKKSLPNDSVSVVIPRSSKVNDKKAPPVPKLAKTIANPEDKAQTEPKLVNDSNRERRNSLTHVSNADSNSKVVKPRACSIPLEESGLLENIMDLMVGVQKHNYVTGENVQKVLKEQEYINADKELKTYYDDMKFIISSTLACAKMVNVSNLGIKEILGESMITSGISTILGNAVAELPGGALLCAALEKAGSTRQENKFISYWSNIMPFLGSGMTNDYEKKVESVARRLTLAKESEILYIGHSRQNSSFFNAFQHGKRSNAGKVIANSKMREVDSRAEDDAQEIFYKIFCNKNCLDDLSDLEQVELLVSYVTVAESFRGNYLKQDANNLEISA